ncbi:MAG: Bax inhibitor-1 family protein [Candidatus Nanohalobium sp.]
MNSNELKSIALSTGLILLNIAVMAVVAVTPLAGITGLLFTVPIIGMIIFGAGLALGRSLAKKGMKQDHTGLAGLGLTLLQLTYGVFGGGILSFVPPRFFPIVLGITAVVTTVIAVAAALLVYGTSRSFRKWGKYSNYLFISAFVTGLIGSALTPLLLLTFILVLAGFLVYLVYELWRMKKRPGRVIMNAIGIYIAYMGVFVEILQIIIEMLGDR